MKKIFEIFLVMFIGFFLIYTLLYNYYFDGLCNKHSGKNEESLGFAVVKLAKCKDSLICTTDNITTNTSNEITDGECNKKDSPVFGKQLYMDIFNHFKNSVTK